MPIQVGAGIGLYADSLEAAKEAIRQARANIKEGNISLAIAFCSSSLAHSQVLKAINSAFGNIPVIGSSGAAVISDYGILKHGLAIMLVGFSDGVHFNTACSMESGLKAGEELGEKLLYGFQNVRRKFGLIFSDGFMEDKTGFIYGLQEKLGQSFPLVGASASSNLGLNKTSVYFNQQALEKAACGIVLGGKFDFGLGIKHGWKPLGKPRYVTRASYNVLYEIDAKPAVKIYEEYLACGILKLKKELKRISVLYPIGIYLAGESEYLLRNVISIGDDGSLALHGEIHEGDEIRLMIGNKESCLLAAEQAAEEAKSGLQNKAPDFALIFDSLSRHILLGRQAHKEIEIVKKVLGGNTSIIGVYTYGEQAPLKAIDYRGKTYLHNQTITILAARGTD